MFDGPIKPPIRGLAVLTDSLARRRRPFCSSAFATRISVLRRCEVFLFLQRKLSVRGVTICGGFDTEVLKVMMMCHQATSHTADTQLEKFPSVPICLYIYIYLHRYVCMYMYIIHICSYIFSKSLSLYVYIYTCKHINMHVYIFYIILCDWN